LKLASYLPSMVLAIPIGWAPTPWMMVPVIFSMSHFAMLARWDPVKHPRVFISNLSRTPEAQREKNYGAGLFMVAIPSPDGRYLYVSIGAPEVVERVSDDVQVGVRAEQTEHGVRVPRVPGLQSLLAVRAHEPRDVRPQHELHEGEVGADERGDPAGGVQDPGGTVDRRRVERRPPEEHDRGAVREEQRRQGARHDGQAFSSTAERSASQGRSAHRSRAG